MLSDGEGQTYQVDKLVYHENYNSLSNANDIGLIRVSSDIAFNDKVDKIALPNSDFTKEDYQVTFTGWGFISVSFFH